jgi:hypothetical protein
MIGGRYQSGFLRTTSKSEFHQRSWSIVNTLPTEVESPASFWESHRPRSRWMVHTSPGKESIALESLVKSLSWRCRSDMNNPPTALVEF